MEQNEQDLASARNDAIGKLFLDMHEFRDNFFKNQGAEISLTKKTALFLRSLWDEIAHSDRVLIVIYAASGDKRRYYFAGASKKIPGTYFRELNKALVKMPPVFILAVTPEQAVEVWALLLAMEVFDSVYCSVVPTEESPANSVFSVLEKAYFPYGYAVVFA